MSAPTNCQRCNRRYNPKRPGDWNAVFKAGRVVALLCPKCQTADEDLEARINEATTVYGTAGDGRVYGNPKVQR